MVLHPGTSKEAATMKRWTSEIRKFHEDESGMEPIAVVMIIAIGAVVLLAIVKIWPTIQTWFKQEVTEVTKMKEE